MERGSGRGGFFGFGEPEGWDGAGRIGKFRSFRGGEVGEGRVGHAFGVVFLGHGSDVLVVIYLHCFTCPPPAAGLETREPQY